VGPGEGCSWLVPGRDLAAETAPLQAGIMLYLGHPFLRCKCPLLAQSGHH
jgi:hypothetical protein